MKLLNSKNLLIVLVFSLLTGPMVRAQVIDDTDSRLYLFCKTWGYVKYFNQNKCFRVWDQYLPNNINDIIAARDNASFNSILMRFLNQAGNNNVIANPPALPDTNLLVQTEWIHDTRFSQEVRNFLDTFTSNIHPDQLACMVRYNNGSSPRAYGWLDFSQDTIDMVIDYTKVSHRLTTVFYYWNVINYFYPYRNLMDEPWDAILQRYIPLFRQPMTVIEFHKLFLKFVSNLRDSHGMSSSDVLVQSFWHGWFNPPVAIERVEGKCVVTVVDSVEGVLPGDILEAVNGRTIKELEDSLSQFICASNEAVLYREIYSNMLRGGLDTEMELTLTNRSGETYSVITSRTMNSTQWIYLKRRGSINVPFTTTQCGYGYVNMGLLQPADVPAMYDSLKNCPAIIFDIRGYPKGTIMSLVPYFFSAPFASALMHIPALYMNISGRLCYYLPGWYYTRDNLTDFGSYSNASPYSGKVYLLVNQETQSHAEYTCQVLSYHPNATVIGTQTAGADGNVSGLFLPGGIITLFTSLGWYYADGYQQQRNGVKIDSIVPRTIAGIRNGKDEILEAALNCASGIPPMRAQEFAINLYPNPASGEMITAQMAMDESGFVRFSLKDISGRVLRDWSVWINSGAHEERIDLSGKESGIYFLQVTGEAGKTKTVKLIKQ